MPLVRASRSRWAWIPIPLLFLAICVVDVADPHSRFESVPVMLSGGFLFIALPSVAISILVVRTFLQTGAWGLLWLAMGIALWGVGGEASVIVGDGSPNRTITAHNLLALASGLCHLIGALTAWRSARRASMPGRALLAAYAGVAAILFAVLLSVAADAIPVFFVQGQGGTPLRQGVLASAVALQVAAAILLIRHSSPSGDPFARWYATGLMVIAVGLFGVITQSVMGGWVSWLGRAAMWLGTVYMLFAALCAVRATGGWRLSLEESVRARDQRIAAQSRLLDLTDDAILIRDADDRIVYWNRGAMRAYGYNGDEALGSTARVLLRTQSEQPLEEIERILLRDGRWEGELRHVSKSGAVIVDLSRWVLQHPEEGSRLHVLESNTNITQRKAAEELLRASERQLQAFIESAPVAIAMLDNQLRYIVVSRRWRMDFNVSDDLVGQRHYDLFPDLPAHWKEAHQRALRGETTEVSQERVQTRKGRPMWLRREVRPWYRGSEVGGIIIYAENVTVRVEADQVLQASEARFRALADAMPQLLWISEPDGTATYYNAQSLRYQHLGAGTQDWHRAVHPDDLPQTYERWRQTIAAAVTYEVEQRLLMADGSYRWHLSRGVPMRDASGRLTHIYGTSTDIDDRKRAEEMLHEVDRRKDAFLAMLSHELRNPLAPIRNAVYAMRRAQVADPHIARCRDIIDRQAAQMARLLDDLLDISRITTGKLRLRTEPLELATVLEQAIETARPLIDEAGHHLEVRLPRQRITLDGDRTRLAQAIANLLVNSAKYTNRNGRIEVVVTRGEHEAEIRVRDNGIGISANDLPRVFELFGQVPSSLTRAHGGLGIGLYLVRALVELHGGRVSARSEGHGHGSEFTVRLPVHAEAPVPEPHHAEGVATSNPQ